MHPQLAHSFHPFAHQFLLSPHGRTVEAMLPGLPHLTTLDGSWDRLTSERAQWAYTHGLHPADGIYLSELRRRRLTLHQLGEALAVFGQDRGAVSVTVRRLCALALVDTIPDDGQGDSIPDDAVARELTAALEALTVVLAEVEGDGPLERRTASVAVRRAMGRVIAARRYYASQAPSSSLR